MKIATLQAKAHAAYEYSYDEHGHCAPQTMQTLQVMATLALAEQVERVALVLEKGLEEANKRK